MLKFFSPRSLLPTIIIVGVLVVFFRVGTLWDAVTTGKFSPPTALAETAAAPAKTEHKKDEKSVEADAKKQEDPAPAETQKYSVRDEERSPAEIEVLNQLSKRREDLERRSRDLDTRDALIKVAEQRVDQKIKEMATLRQQLQSMVGQASEAQAVQVDNLVKIYETMKPDEAAKILETLDMPVLLGVIQRMKPARTAPIMAKMNPEKAKDITVALTRQDQLPQIK